MVLARNNGYAFGWAVHQSHPYKAMYTALPCQARDWVTGIDYKVWEHELSEILRGFSASLL